MNEYTIGFIACGNLIALAIGAAFYMAGGRNNKALRRFVGSFIIALAINLTSVYFDKWSAWLLLLYPMLILQFSLGYGGNGNIQKWLQRALIALLATGTGYFLCVILGGGIWLMIIQAIVSSTTIFFSFKNEIAAASEEPLVCVLNNLLLMFYPFVIQ